MPCTSAVRASGRRRSPRRAPRRRGPARGERVAGTEQVGGALGQPHRRTRARWRRTTPAVVVPPLGAGRLSRRRHPPFSRPPQPSLPTVRPDLQIKSSGHVRWVSCTVPSGVPRWTSTPLAGEVAHDVEVVCAESSLGEHDGRLGPPRTAGHRHRDHDRRALRPAGTGGRPSRRRTCGRRGRAARHPRRPRCGRASPGPARRACCPRVRARSRPRS